MKKFINDVCSFKSTSKFVRTFVVNAITEGEKHNTLDVTVMKTNKLTATLEEDFKLSYTVNKDGERVDSDGITLKGKLCKYRSMSLKKGTLGSSW